MTGKKIFYITTNGSWSGSEELWTRSAKDFIEKKYPVAYASKYDHPVVRDLQGVHYLFSGPHKKNLIKRVAAKLFNIRFKYDHPVATMLKKERPALVILSQGNNIDQDNVMKCCRDLNIPYVTITNLVTEYHFLSVTAENLTRLQQDYAEALMNYFVSAKNLELNNRMLAMELKNAEVIFCPQVLTNDQIPGYPANNGVYQIGLVGRIECFHKGYDLLLELAAMEKWRSRPVKFNIYGDGPHKELIRQNIVRLGIDTMDLKGYEKSAVVWKSNHILFMPSRMEGVALSLIEAMYCKRAAVVTDVGDAATLITDGANGFVAASATVVALDEALERAWEKREQWKELGMNASDSLEKKYGGNAVAYFNKKIRMLLDEMN